ncbi:MAG: polysaccharide biosynthesis/export family protein [Bacteroidales bacterium]|jgi:polysaccharide export outer membrane protein|nr:polysaccharide biosynthesis/export family protein [Bacteroidales bacterium]
MKQKSSHFLLFATIIIIFGACTPQKQLIYFQNDTPKDSTYTYVYPKDKSEFSQPYTLTENDELYINIIAPDPDNQEMFGKITVGSGSNATEMSIYMNSYTIDAKGNITIPALEPIYVKGLTLEEARIAIENAAKEIAFDAVVVCKLVNFRVDILGEINRPGKYSYYQDKVSIWDAISNAGDLTYFANRASIKIIRKEKSKDVIYTLDLRSADILQDPNYFLKSGDVIYVEPNKSTKAFSNFNIPMGTIASSLSVISAAISLVLLVVTLKK